MEHVDAVVIGMGPGGETVAGRLLAAGRRVAVIERELIGGECGYWACIPTKVLLRPPEVGQEAEGAAGLSRPELEWSGLRAYRDRMIRHLDDSAQARGYQDQGALVLRGPGRLTGRDPWRIEVEGTEVTADHVVVATGSEALRPPIEGLGDLDTSVVWTNREATTLTDVPGRALVVGGSAVGVELGQFLARMGSRVTVVQRGPRLVDREEPRLCGLVGDQLERDGITVRLNTQVSSVVRDGGGVRAALDDGSHVDADVVVLATGRRPRTGGLGLEEAGVELDRSALVVDERCRAAPGLWGVGDVTGRMMFTHVAKYQGRVVADNILGGDRGADYTAVPRVVFSYPEVAGVGITAGQARERGIDTATAEVDLPGSLARPWTYDTDPRGTLGLVADRGRGVLVGAWAFAPMAAEWIHTAALAIRTGLTVEALVDTIPQFPTFNEAYLVALEELDL
ncbi:pyridine nucleotide-disulfide oxidoreductase [Nocardiopsis sp. TSRI0078]|uniref:dihydrolipoyl dehydrogenase family protein n=1 Tax=unclassified Nocardiopsis TaxID=2649073 RepID=UPI00093E174C|nr:NAD(P)/FAD-dependent oxidoreductase [Nocardiopsis sp. TSRI0078]OKI19784.1 pyridine nucleotide-disulfide oxidoreductase [Nocardiopsis sp. TSRI0078]